MDNRLLFQTLLVIERKLTMKKTFVSTVIGLLLLIVLASRTVAATAAEERQLPLKGSLEAVETHQIVLPTMFVDGTGSGNATQLGVFTMSFQAEVSLPSLAASTSSTLIAANGDRIFGEGSGQGTPTADPNLVSIVETYTITGGTGRFANATGSFTVERLINRSTLTSSGTISGIIMLP
jgi:hypothetical protein